MYKSCKQILPNLNIHLLIAILSIMGALLRWKLNTNFVSNIVGCALIGLISGLKLNSKLKLAFAIGFCGSLTTFSGWIWDFVGFFKSGFVIQAFSELFSTLFAGFFFLSLGFWFGKTIK